MAKAVLISIRPEGVEKIANGEKTLELRKTEPKLETPFKVYIYCTAGNLSYEVNNGMMCNISGGKLVVGEFVCDRIERICGYVDIKNLQSDFVGSCLSPYQIEAYLNGKDGYMWHISKLEIYDMPRKLSEFWFPDDLYCEKELCGGCPWDQSPDIDGEYEFDCGWRRPLRRPPQSWCYVEKLQ